MASHGTTTRIISIKRQPNPSAATVGPVQTPALYRVLLGSATQQSPQYGLLGLAKEDHERPVALDLNTIHCGCLFGEPGAGKSYCLGTIIEMALRPLPGLNHLPRPLASVIFHYSPSPAYKPEMATAIHPNDRASDLAVLRDLYKADPARLRDVVLLSPSDMVDTRRAEFPGIQVEPLRFTPGELTAAHWKILMGAVGEDDSLYLHVINTILRRHRRSITPELLRQEVEASRLSRDDKDRALVRIQLVEDYLGATHPVGDWLRRGRMVILDLRDEYLQKREALALAIVLLQVFADRNDPDGRPCQKLFVFDEAHKYMRDAHLVEVLTETVREMRHKATSVLIASQDPPSVPQTIIELASLVVLLRMSAPQWVRHVQEVKLAFAETHPGLVASLSPGEALVWCKLASDPGYMEKPYRLQIRPRATRHGGATKTALPVDEVDSIDATPRAS